MKASKPLATGVTVLVHAILMAAGASGTARAESWRERLATPAPGFSQMPFWFWNDRLDEAEIKRQMADFRAHGVYGFVIHGRMGLPREIAYMGPEWKRLVKATVDEAARTGMRVCLYDEGMYPSGSAHGEVVKSNPAFASQGVAMLVQEAQGPADVPCPPCPDGKHIATHVAAAGTAKNSIDPGTLRRITDPGGPIHLGAGQWRIMTFTRVPSGGRIRGVHEGEEDREPGAPAAADLLNAEAMQAFIRLAYEPYYELLKPHFGGTVIGMFTDEPGMLGRGGRRGLQPWTEGLEAYFQAKRGYSIIDLLPALFLDAGPRTAGVREDFRRTLADRLDETYYRQLSEWCQNHGISLTGHPAGATEIHPMRFFQIPGQDIVWRGVAPEGNKALEGTNSAIGKCSSSVARHDRRSRNSNEVYGAFGWQLTMEEMKWLADWLMVRGVDLLYPHAFYYSIRDYRVNERPPDVGPHNLWWDHYRRFADYTSRVCGLLAGSRQVCETAVLGSNHNLPWRAARWLYRNQVDFNYLEGWRLIEQARLAGGRLEVGDMRYSLVIVDADVPPDGAVATRLREIEAAGVKVRQCRGQPEPGLVEGVHRDVVAEPAADDLRCLHLVRDSLNYCFLVNEGESRIETTLRISCRGECTLFDAWTGEFRPASLAGTDAGSVSVRINLPRRESIVLCIDTAALPQPVSRPGRPARSPVEVKAAWAVTDPAGHPVGEGPGDWLKAPATAAFTGTLTYRARVTIDRKPGSRYLLDLGQVGDFATLQVNGRDYPVRFWRPYAWDVTEALRDGANEVVVKVTNSLINRYDANARRPSGLLGPVRVVEEKSE